MLFFLSDYAGAGFLYLQYNVDIGIIKALNSSVDARKIHMQTMRFPFPTYDKRKKKFRTTYGPKSLYYVLVLEIIVCSISIARDVTYDKEKGIHVCFIYFIEHVMKSHLIRLEL